MNFKPNNARALMATYLGNAEERLESAQALLKIENYEDAISRAYYAVLDAATACLIAKDIIPKSHAGAIKLFSLHYIKTGEVSKEYQKQFTKIEKARVEADYTHIRKFSKEEAEEICEQSRQFVKMAAGLLQK